MSELRDEGKVRHIGLTEVSVDELRQAQKVVRIASVQNRYNLTYRGSDAVLEACEGDGLAFIPWFPLAAGPLARPGGPVDEIASRHGATAGQAVLAWLPWRSPVMLPIPGTSSVDHLDKNVAAASRELTDEEYAELTG